MTQTSAQDSKDWLDGVLATAMATFKEEPWNGREALTKAKTAIESHYAKELEKADARETKALEERDVLEDKLDSLSEAVAAYFKVDIGEHSNVNDPVYNAYQLLRDNTRTDQINRERD